MSSSTFPGACGGGIQLKKNNAKIKYMVLEGSDKSKMNKKNITLKYISII